MTRRFLCGFAMSALGLTLLVSSGRADEKKIKVGLMLPYTGTYASLGNAITNGFKLALAERGGKLGGRAVDIVTVDDESDPAKAPENTNKLIKQRAGRRDRRHRALGRRAGDGEDRARDRTRWSSTPTPAPTSSPGRSARRASSAPRSPTGSPPTRWARSPPTSKHKTAITVSWKYTAGEQSANGFKEAFEKGGGKVVKQLYVPFPDVEFQALLTDIAASKPDAVYAFFSGGGAVKFVKD